MRRNLPTRTLLSTDDTTNDSKFNFCPIPPKTGPESSGSNEIDDLLIQYQSLVTQIRAIRGKLYSRGVDPEKYT
jgi:hypothetical protein